MKNGKCSTKPSPYTVKKIAGKRTSGLVQTPNVPIGFLRVDLQGGKIILRILLVVKGNLLYI
jgi:hypothetical protein